MSQLSIISLQIKDSRLTMKTFILPASFLILVLFNPTWVIGRPEDSESSTSSETSTSTSTVDPESSTDTTLTTSTTKTYPPSAVPSQQIAGLETTEVSIIFYSLPNFNFNSDHPAMVANIPHGSCEFKIPSRQHRNATLVLLTAYFTVAVSDFIEAS